MSLYILNLIIQFNKKIRLLTCVAILRQPIRLIMQRTLTSREAGVLVHNERLFCANSQLITPT